MKLSLISCLIWRLFIVKRIEVVCNTFQWLMTILLFVTLPLLRMSELMPTKTQSKTYDAKVLLSLLDHANNNLEMFYTPINNATELLMNKIVQSLPHIGSLYDTDTVLGKVMLNMLN